MNSTLADRLKEAMKGPPRVTGVSLAKACQCSTPSVSDWRSGKTMTMEGGHLLAAAKHLGVDPNWLAFGVGVKHPRPELPTSYRQSRINHAMKLMEQMTDYQVDQTVRIIDTLAEPADKNGTCG